MAVSLPEYIGRRQADAVRTVPGGRNSIGAAPHRVRAETAICEAGSYQTSPDPSRKQAQVADRRETTMWATHEVIPAAEIAVADVRVDAIAEQLVQ